MQEIIKTKNACYYYPVYKVFLKILKNIHNEYCNLSKIKSNSDYDFMDKDNDLRLCLISNGCNIITKDKPVKSICYNIEDQNINFLLVFNMFGNKICEHFDYINLGPGKRYIVVFAYSFKGLFLNELDDMFGKSSYIDIIIKIIELYMSITTEYNKLENDVKFSSTAAMNNYRLLPTFIAYAVIKKIFGKIYKSDVFGFDYDDLMYKLNTFTIEELCNGIRLKE